MKIHINYLKMELTTKLDENYRLDYIDSDWKLATVYTAFLIPKSQQEAIRLIYGIRTTPGKRAPVIHQPVQWISDTREILMEHGLLHRKDQKLRGTQIGASIEPIVQSLIDAGAQDSTDPVVLDGVRIILNSSWFRNFFSFDNLHSPISYQNGEVYEPYQNLVKQNLSGKKLEIKNLQNRMFQLLSEIGYYSHNIRYLVKRVTGLPRTHGEDPLFEELIGQNDFDALCNKISEDIPKDFIPWYRDSIVKSPLSAMTIYYPERLFKKLLDDYAALCMPSQVSVLLRSAPCITAVKPLDCAYIQQKFLQKRREEKDKAIE